MDKLGGAAFVALICLLPAVAVTGGLWLLCRALGLPEPLAFIGLALAVPHLRNTPFGVLLGLLPLAAVVGVLLAVFK